MMDILCWLKNFGPGVSAVVAAISVAVAATSYITQSALSRKRATLDFLLKLKTDGKALELWENYVNGLAAFANATDKENFAKSSPKEFISVRSYLNIFELIACGANEGILDKKMCRNYYEVIFRENYASASPFIDLFRDDSNGRDAYCEFVKLTKEWS